MTTQEKYLALQEYLKSLGSVAVAYSSGVDSTLLLKVAKETLGVDNVLAVTATSGSFPLRERDESIAFCEAEGIEQVVFAEDELAVEGFVHNQADRCYHCKHSLFEDIMDIAKEHGKAFVVEGSNMDDNGDYRPGLIAIAELGVKSPLRHVGLYKDEIRELSRELGLPTWKKPAFACLASRVPYGQTITSEKLDRIGAAEQKLVDLGFGNMRVRDHNDGEIARIELDPKELPRIYEPQIAEEVDTYFKSLGYTFVAVELRGYHTGSMNRTIPKEEWDRETAAQAKVAGGADK
ncbi:MAG: ATP-dependent sacrificial sulfur transferase LarE [Clostridia bacterium]|nr:ATP-dependent sacrificial sulfur transferase LarE [Clostridia bacterium]